MIFNCSFYIPAIQKLYFQLPHVHILSTNHCGDLRHTAFKLHELFQYILCFRDYSERVVAIFAHQIQLEYYGGNISVSIEGIALEHFSELPKDDINSTTPSRQRHAVFHSFYLKISNRMTPILLQTSSVLFHCSKTK